jgi:hypothetical protein
VRRLQRQTKKRNLLRELAHLSSEGRADKTVLLRFKSLNSQKHASELSKLHTAQQDAILRLVSLFVLETDSQQIETERLDESSPDRNLTMPSTEKLDTHHKALTLNLDASAFGSFAEIGAGQEVAR